MKSPYPICTEASTSNLDDPVETDYVALMWTQPHFKYYATNWHPDLAGLEYWVPGTLAWAHVYNPEAQRTFRVRVEKIEGAPEIQRYEVFVPLHGAWLVEGYLTLYGVTFSAEPVNVGDIDFWREDERRRGALEAEGLLLARQMTARGQLKEHVPDVLTPYQLMCGGWAVRRPWLFAVWSCGSGKTLGAIVSSFTHTGATLVLCPAKARHVWWSQVLEYTNILPYRVRPQGERKQGDQTLSEYLDACMAAQQDPFVIIGAEALHDYMEEARLTQPTTLIFDELHIHGSSKRWQAIHKEDGTVGFERKKTKANKQTRAAAVMDLSRMGCIKFRMGLTATPLDDGRPRRMWSQLDLLSPGGFSHSYSKFAMRYCDAREGEWGGLDDRGSSNLEELRARCSFFTHEVAYSESHAALPSTRVQVVYLDRDDLNGAGRYNEEQTFHQAFKSISKEARFNHLAKERLIEARLAQACSRKRKYVVDEVKQGLRHNGKVVVFTSRRAETEVWAHEIRKAISQGDERLESVKVWMAHGGVSETERDRITDAYRDHPGPCCLVATGQSVGTGVDGMQTTSLAVFAMLPWKPGDFMQWKGRFDRLGGAATLLKVIVATGTYDERVVDILVEKFGPIEAFLQADELKGLDSKLRGLDDREKILTGLMEKIHGAASNA
tara:strand:+ start:3376 stop:5370 length:1995 start_codon:yes stop_codon:yes gene_type:complete